MSIVEIQEALRSRFFNAEKVIDIIYTAVILKKNLVLWGDGGFGKSEITKAVLELMKKPVNVIVGYEDMDVEALIGLPNMDKLLKDSKYEVAFENSVFVNKGVLIFEEMADVRPATAAALKDILTEGGYRRGSEFVKSNIDVVIACTNKSPAAISDNASLAALYEERFPLNLRVEWNSYTRDDYFKLLTLSEYDEKKRTDLFVLAELLSKSPELISPRIALHAKDIVLNFGIDKLWVLPKIDTSIIEDVKRNQSILAEKEYLLSIVSTLEGYLKDMHSISFDDDIVVYSALTRCNAIIAKLGKIEIIHPENMQMLLDITNKYQDYINLLKDKIGSFNHKDLVEISKLFEK